MKSAQNTKQLDRANRILQELAINVTALDRADAEKELRLVKSTISTYLKGEGSDVDKSIKLIEFFTPRIKEREKKLTSAA